jgi:hypothetical protein
LKFFGSKSESAAGFGLVGDALGMELLGTPLDASLPGDCMLPQPAPSTQTHDKLASKVSAERPTRVPSSGEQSAWATRDWLDAGLKES